MASRNHGGFERPVSSTLLTWVCLVMVAFRPSMAMGERMLVDRIRPSGPTTASWWAAPREVAPILSPNGRSIVNTTPSEPDSTLTGEDSTFPPSHPVPFDGVPKPGVRSYRTVPLAYRVRSRLTESFVHSSKRTTGDGAVSWSRARPSYETDR